ncbi:MAG: hypothetical protein M3O95_11745, partial [Candidatus Dormibacteraeota bacterium]|nr:hypothetical protein [Candidatus Dormibacteraeota bacterium]
SEFGLEPVDPRPQGPAVHDAIAHLRVLHARRHEPVRQQAPPLVKVRPLALRALQHHLQDLADPVQRPLRSPGRLRRAGVVIARRRFSGLPFPEPPELFGRGQLTAD